MCNFFPALQAWVLHGLVNEKRVVVAHESERHDACCWENVGLRELVCISWSGSAETENEREQRTRAFNWNATRIGALVASFSSIYGWFVVHVTVRGERTRKTQTNNSTGLFSFQLFCFSSAFSDFLFASVQIRKLSTFLFAHNEDFVLLFPK